MDTQLSVLDIEVIFLEHLAGKAYADAWTHLQLRDVELLSTLKFRFPRSPITLEQVRAAAEQSRALKVKTAEAQLVDGFLSRYVIACSPRHLTGVTPTANQATFRTLARHLRESGGRPVAQLRPDPLILQAICGTLTLRNVGPGGPDAIRITGLELPAWLTGTAAGPVIQVQPVPSFNGIYRGHIRIQTSAGEVKSSVTLDAWRCPPLLEDLVSLKSLVTRHPDLDEDAVTERVTAHLTAVGYLCLPGGFFKRPSPGVAAAGSPTVPGRTLEWTITPEYLRTGRLPAVGHTPRLRFYSPDGADPYEIQFDGQALCGEALEEFLTLWEVGVGTHLMLQPYRGQYQVQLGGPELAAGLVAGTADLNAQRLSGGQHLGDPQWSARQAAGTVKEPQVPSPRLPVVPELAPYTVFRGQVAHPAGALPAEILSSVLAILRVEGPAVGHHLYMRYGVAIQRQHNAGPLAPRALKQLLNRVMSQAVRERQVLADDEAATGGQIGLVYRLPGQSVRPRQRGDRTLLRIPRSELCAVMAQVPGSHGTPQERNALVLKALGFTQIAEEEHELLMLLEELVASTSSRPVR